MTTQHQTNVTQVSRPNAAVGALWASAMVIMAMIIVQSGRLGTGNVAEAGVTSDIANLRLLTSQSNVDEEVLTVLDQNNETISAYLVVNSRSLELFDVVSLPSLFKQAQGASRR